VADELLAIDAVGFLVSGLLSYIGIKDADPERKHKKGRAGDILFTLSLSLLAVICAIVAFELL
jgi:hypothetical protein